MIYFNAFQVFIPPPKGTRKAILTTNIAETSVTVPNVRFVIDAGVVKQRFHDAASGMDALHIVPISKSQAKQRAGRAGKPLLLFFKRLFPGREAPGKVFRLYTSESYQSLETYSRPEIVRANLAEVVLKLKMMGIEDILNFDFITPPPKLALIRSLQILHNLGALDNEGRVTNGIGSKMSRFPLEPMLSRMLIEGLETGSNFKK